jgi:hypothetical protein
LSGPQRLDSGAECLCGLPLQPRVRGDGSGRALPPFDGPLAHAAEQGQGDARYAEGLAPLADGVHDQSLPPDAGYCKCRDTLLEYVEKGGAAGTARPVDFTSDQEAPSMAKDSATQPCRKDERPLRRCPCSDCAERMARQTKEIAAYMHRVHGVRIDAR